MKAIVCEAWGLPDTLVVRERPDVVPEAGKVAIKVEAAGVNFPDVLIIQNKYQFKPELPFTPGGELAGTVMAVGEGVTQFKAGDRVIAFVGQGAFAQQIAVPVQSVMPMPPGMDFDTAAAITLTYGTSHHAVVDRAQLKAGETMLVLGAAGGVGTAAIQIAKAAGARVIAAAGSDAKCEACKTLGADAAINYTTQNLRDELKPLTEGQGPDVIYDPVGGDLSEAAFRSIAWRGRYLVIGFAQGQIPALPLNLALLKGASLVGVFWGEFAKREPGHNARMLGELAAWYGAGKIKPVLDRVLPMEELPAAFARMAAREVVGKLVLTN